MTRPERRRRAESRGRKAETIAAWWLRLKGYRVLARDFRVPFGEIDLLVQRGRLLAAVEVKARQSHRQAAEAIGPRQRQRIARALSVFLQRRPELAGCDLRFDALLIVPWRLPRHLVDAWRDDPPLPGRGFG